MFGLLRKLGEQKIQLTIKGNLMLSKHNSNKRLTYITHNI